MVGREEWRGGVTQAAPAAMAAVLSSRAGPSWAESRKDVQEGESRSILSAGSRRTIDTDGVARVRGDSSGKKRINNPERV